MSGFLKLHDRRSNKQLAAYDATKHTFTLYLIQTACEQHSATLGVFVERYLNIVKWVKVMDA